VIIDELAAGFRNKVSKGAPPTEGEVKFRVGLGRSDTAEERRGGEAERRMGIK